jgi:hypothetical protein
MLLQKGVSGNPAGRPKSIAAQTRTSAELTLDQADEQTLIIDLVYSELSPGLANYLTRQGVWVVADLLTFKPRLEHRGVGRMTIREINDFLDRWKWAALMKRENIK